MGLQISGNKALWWTATLAATSNRNLGGGNSLLCSADEQAASAFLEEGPSKLMPVVVDESFQLEMAEKDKLEGEECVPDQGQSVPFSAASLEPDVGILSFPPGKIRPPGKMHSPGKIRPPGKMRRWREKLAVKDESKTEPDVGILESLTCEGSLECVPDDSSSLGGRCLTKKDVESGHGERQAQLTACFESCPSVAFCQCVYGSQGVEDYYGGDLSQLCSSYIVAVCADEPSRDACLVGTSGPFWKNYYCPYFTCWYEDGSFQKCRCHYYCNPQECHCVETRDFDPSCVAPMAMLCNYGFVPYCSVYDNVRIEQTSCYEFTCLATGETDAVCRCLGVKKACQYFALSSRETAQYYCAVADCCGKATSDQQRSSCFFKTRTADLHLVPSMPPTQHLNHCPSTCDQDLCDCILAQNQSQQCISLLAHQCRSQTDCELTLFGYQFSSSACTRYICLDDGGTTNECSCKQQAESCASLMDAKLYNNTVCTVTQCCEGAVTDDDKGACLEANTTQLSSQPNSTSSTNPTQTPVLLSTNYPTTVPSMSPTMQASFTTNATNNTAAIAKPSTTNATKVTSSSSSSMDGYFPMELIIPILAGVYMLLSAF